MSKTIVLAAALVAIVPAAASASDPQQRTIVVHTADLDLTTAEGQDLLDERIDSAARTACGRPNIADYVDRGRDRMCRASLTRPARQQAQVLIARHTEDRALAAR